MRYISALLFPRDDHFGKALLRFFLIGLFFHLLAVIFTEGFHRPDEHLGITRYVFWKLGYLSEDFLKEVSWEHNARIRSWIQPAFYYAWLKPFHFFGLNNPFYLTMLMRLISSILAISTSVVLLLLSKKYIKDFTWQRVAIFLSFTLWYFPFFHARSTAENFGSITLILGLYPFLWCMPPEKERKLHRWAPPFFMSLLGASLLALTVPLRVPSGPTIAIIYLWFFIIGRLHLRSIIPIFFGTVLALGITILIDSWGYGASTFSLYNFIYQEFVNNVSNRFGTDPWWKYFELVFNRGIPPLSLLFIVPTIWFWIKKPFHLLTWITASFFILHSLIGHKELRFIFGIGMFLPIIIALVLEEWWQKTTFQQFVRSSWGKALLSILLIQNFSAMMISSLRPAHSAIGFYKHIYYSPLPITEIFTLHVVRDPLVIYMPRPIKLTHIEGGHDAFKIINAHQGEDIYFAMDKLADADFFNTIPYCKVEHIPYSESIRRFIKNTQLWSLYRCKK